MDLEQPVFPPPPGYVVDLANPQRSGVVINLCVGTVGMCIAALFVGTRLYTKLAIARQLTWDDGKSFHPLLPRFMSAWYRIANNCRSGSRVRLGVFNPSSRTSIIVSDTANVSAHSSSLSRYSLEYCVSGVQVCSDVMMF
jgi:hypothetical protein